jgi:hypothetical protein
MAISRATSGRVFGWSLGIVALCLSSAAISSSGSDPSRPDGTPVSAAFQQQDGSAAGADSQSFDDAPYGVDPIVTGPVSAAFKNRQQALHCAEAAWPNIPAGCYPD